MVDAKAAVSGPPLDPEVAALAPAGAPAILHDPEVLAALRAVAHSGDCVVVGVLAVGVGGFLAAPAILEDAVAVVEQVGRLQELHYKKIMGR